MKIENMDDRLILISAFRYALGRMTYMPSVVASAIKDNWDEFTEYDKSLFQKEIQEAFDQERYGMECDKATWKTILNMKI